MECSWWERASKHIPEQLKVQRNLILTRLVRRRRRRFPGRFMNPIPENFLVKATPTIKRMLLVFCLQLIIPRLDLRCLIIINGGTATSPWRRRLRWQQISQKKRWKSRRWRRRLVIISNKNKIRVTTGILQTFLVLQIQFTSQMPSIKREFYFWGRKIFDLRHQKFVFRHQVVGGDRLITNKNKRYSVGTLRYDRYSVNVSRIQFPRHQYQASITKFLAPQISFRWQEFHFNLMHLNVLDHHIIYK